MRRHPSSGLTLIELMVVIAVLAILLSVALPSFQNTMDRRRVIGAADILLADMRYAQSESVKRNVTVSVDFTTGSSWSYTINTDPVKTTSGADYRGTSLAATLTGGGATMTFSPLRGTVSGTPALILVTSELGNTLGVEVNALSHMRLCTTSGMGSYPACGS